MILNVLQSIKPGIESMLIHCRPWLGGSMRLKPLDRTKATLYMPSDYHITDTLHLSLVAALGLFPILMRLQLVVEQ